MSLQAGASKPDENPTINIQFKIQQMAISGTHTHTHTYSYHHHTVMIVSFISCGDSFLLLRFSVKQLVYIPAKLSHTTYLIINELISFPLYILN